MQTDQAGADIGPADIDAKNGVMGLEHPARRQVSGADEAGFVRIVADDPDLGLDLVVLQQHRGAADRKLADAAAGKSAAEYDALRMLPGLQLEKSPHHAGKLLGEGLDRALHDAC